MENASNSGNISRATNRTNSSRDLQAMLTNWLVDIALLTKSPGIRHQSTTNLSSSHESLILYTYPIINAEKKLARIIKRSFGGLTLSNALSSCLAASLIVYLR